MYRTEQVVGDVFENKVMDLFDLVKADSQMTGMNPDLFSQDQSFCFEVKASSYTNGGVINKTQLKRFGKKVNVRRFYAFAYHSITKDMKKDYPNKDALIKALDFRSLYILPFSVVDAHFDSSKKRVTPLHDTYVQLIESLAEKIFTFDDNEWKRLRLKKNKYKTIRPCEKVNIMTSNGNLEQELLGSLNQDLI